MFVGAIVVAVQGGFIGRWSRRFGDRRLIYLGLGTLAVGLILVSLTPRVPPPFYSKTQVENELASSGDIGSAQNPAAQNVATELPPDNPNGWRGLVWILVAMVPVAVGGGVLQPSINSLITKRVNRGDVGGMLGISASFLSAANAIAPLLMGIIFQVFGSTSPFFLGGLLMAVLLFLSMRWIQPGKEEQVPGGLASSGPAN